MERGAKTPKNSVKQCEGRDGRGGGLTRESMRFVKKKVKGGKTGGSKTGERTRGRKES